MKSIKNIISPSLYGLIIWLLSACFQYSLAQGQQRDNSHLQLAGSFGRLLFDSDIVNQASIASAAFDAGIQANYISHGWVTSLSLDWLNYVEKNKFTETVRHFRTKAQDIRLDISTVQARMLSFAVGKTLQLGRETSLYTQTGYSYVLNSSRQNFEQHMHDKKIDLEGGLFLTTGANYNFGLFSIGLRNTYYFTGQGLDNNIALTIGSRF